MTWNLSAMLFPSVERSGKTHDGMTDAYAWTPDLVTGNDAVDDQHRQLINALNRLVDASRFGKGHAEVKKTLNFLVKYTAKHFADEEALQREHEYPEYENHKRIHTEFTNVVMNMTHAYRRLPSDALIANIITAIGQWVTNHIKSEDKVMAEYVLNRIDPLPARWSTPPILLRR
jgi:hemerythrin